MNSQQRPITILRADDTDAFGLRTITIKLTGDLDLTNATAKFTLLGYTKTWTNAETATGTLTMVMSAQDTKSFPLGLCFGSLSLFDIEGATAGSVGKRITVCNTIPFDVKNSVECFQNDEYTFDVKLNVDTEINIDFTIEGKKGDKGDKGDAATIAVGTTTTLPAGSSAVVENVGTSSAAIFNFKIPKGADGATQWSISGDTISPADANVKKLNLGALASTSAIGTKYTLADVKNLCNALLSALKG